ncbi:unnamed protein product [Clonostachys byssicola]|uniref:FAD dependent oxidoreductase domain-containing protein n=1 Tax=Clonostachys byssicola TaxID=160290 RepID=A0A9N9UNY8_9HYPO|nr:unnamed protein product [Clonostachys byssicola]
MPKITILGAGITGLAIASQLPSNYDITIVAKELPGDDTLKWASPWAGAIWMPIHGANAEEQRVQLNSLAFLTKLAASNPESTVRFEVLPKSRYPEGVKYAMKYNAVTMHPQNLIKWLESRLKAKGVKFHRAGVTSLGALKHMGHDVLINASGLGAAALKDVHDPQIMPCVTHLIEVRHPYDQIWMRHNKDYSVYTYILPRGDGTAVLGGSRFYGEWVPKIIPEVRQGIIDRLHKNLPEHFPADIKDIDFISDITGVHQQQEGGLKLYKQHLNGQDVVHAYAFRGGGFMLSFGLANEVAQMVNKHLFTYDARL